MRIVDKTVRRDIVNKPVYIRSREHARRGTLPPSSQPVRLLPAGTPVRGRIPVFSAGIVSYIRQPSRTLPGSHNLLTFRVPGLPSGSGTAHTTAVSAGDGDVEGTVSFLFSAFPSR